MFSDLLCFTVSLAVFDRSMSFKFLIAEMKCCRAMDEKLDGQDFSFEPLPRYKCLVRYNCFLFSHTWLYSKVNLCVAKECRVH